MRKVKTVQDEYMSYLSAKDFENIRNMAQFYLMKDKQHFLDKTVAEVWTEAVLHQFLKMGLMRPVGGDK